MTWKIVFLLCFFSLLFSGLAVFASLTHDKDLLSGVGACAIISAIGVFMAGLFKFMSEN